MIGNFINFIKSKTLTDVVYIVIMVLIVTLIKDMVTSMIRKRKDKKWLVKAFKKDDVVEGFNIVDSCPLTLDDNASVCDKLQFLLCNANFGKMKNLLKNIDVKDDNTGKIDISTNGGSLFTLGGVVDTRKRRDNSTGGEFINTDGGYIVTGGGNIVTGGGNIVTVGGLINTVGGKIYTGKGEINTQGGNITTTGGYIFTTGGYINTQGGNITTSRGTIFTGSGLINTQGGNITTSGGDITTTGGDITTTGGDITNGTGNVTANAIEALLRLSSREVHVRDIRTLQDPSGRKELYFYETDDIHPILEIKKNSTTHDVALTGKPTYGDNKKIIYA